MPIYNPMLGNTSLDTATVFNDAPAASPTKAPLRSAGGLAVAKNAIFGDAIAVGGAMSAGKEIIQAPLSADPAAPADGHSVMWVSDGTGAGNAGDIMLKITVGATTKTITLVDFTAAV